LAELDGRDLRILINGGSGYIGTNASRALRLQGHVVTRIHVAPRKDPSGVDDAITWLKDAAA